jgi:hypothetical protein
MPTSPQRRSASPDCLPKTDSPTAIHRVDDWPLGEARPRDARAQRPQSAPNARAAPRAPRAPAPAGSPPWRPAPDPPAAHAAHAAPAESGPATDPVARPVRAEERDERGGTEDGAYGADFISEGSDDGRSIDDFDPPPLDSAVGRTAAGCPSDRIRDEKRRALRRSRRERRAQALHLGLTTQYPKPKGLPAPRPIPLAFSYDFRHSKARQRLTELLRTAPLPSGFKPNGDCVPRFMPPRKNPPGDKLKYEFLHMGLSSKS